MQVANRLQPTGSQWLMGTGTPTQVRLGFLRFLKSPACLRRPHPGYAQPTLFWQTFHRHRYTATVSAGRATTTERLAVTMDSVQMPAPGSAYRNRDLCDRPDTSPCKGQQLAKTSRRASAFLEPTAAHRGGDRKSRRPNASYFLPALSSLISRRRHGVLVAFLVR